MAMHGSDESLEIRGAGGWQSFTRDCGSGVARAGQEAKERSDESTYFCLKKISHSCR